jgi:hypothetical protein
MSKRLIGWKQTLLLLSLGGAALAVPLPGFCAQYLTNSDLVAFYGNAGANTIDSVFDPARNLFKTPAQVTAGNVSDWEAIVVNPTVTVLENMWRHWVWTQVPADPPGVTYGGD